jgi:flagellar biogenesis protein FliO
MSAAFWTRYIAAIATVCVALWIFARVARRLRSRTVRENGEHLRQIASLTLAPNVTVHVVRAAEREFLIAAGATICALESASGTSQEVRVPIVCALR